jgi:hypothetical protein
VRNPERGADLLKRREAVLEKRSAIDRKLPPESENHGWVWLFLRKAPGKTAELAVGRLRGNEDQT